MACVLKVDDVVTRFGERLVHDHISLNVASGEIYGLLGAAGCGKSTLMREIILLEPVQSGSIRLFGDDITAIDYKEEQWLRQRWGVLFQSNALFTSLSIAENIALVFKESTRLSQAMIDEVVAFKLDIVGLSQRDGGLYPAQLSGGMRKKAALARALAMDPALLFLDEPTTGLDPISARDFDALILRLRDMLRLTIIMVTHDLASIRTTLDRMAIIDEGHIIAEGTLDEVTKSDNPFIKRFFGGIST